MSTLSKPNAHVRLANYLSKMEMQLRARLAPNHQGVHSP